MKSKKTTKKIKNAGIKTQKLTWKTVEQVFKKSVKKPAFQQAYRVETERIKIAQTIKNTRLKRRLTQATVAKRANMPQSVIARLESGNHSVSLDTLSRVANALGKQVELV